MKAFEEINTSIAYISQKLGNVIVVYFQVLNENQDDWDEEKTNLEYQIFMTEYLKNKNI
jgi:hypothetical protein